MVSASNIAPNLEYKNHHKVLVQDHDTDDIVHWIGKVHPMTTKQYDLVSDMHWQGDVPSTCKHLWTFLKDNVKYSVESGEDQTIKYPGAILAHGKGDCKHYASYIVGVMDSLRRKGYPVDAFYRFTADKPDMEVHHVFAVVKHGNKNIYVDPVLDHYNAHPHYYNIKDSHMPLTLISGTEMEESVGRHHSKHRPDDQASQGKHKHHGFLQKIKKGLHTFKEINLKIAELPMRKAFLSIVALNIHGLARTLKKVLDSPDRQKLLDRWHKKLRGSEKLLIHAIEHGAKRRKIFGEGGEVGKLHLPHHLKATDLLFPGSHELRLAHDKFKKHHIKIHPTDFIPGMHEVRMLRNFRRKHRHKKVGFAGVDDAAIAIWVGMAATVIGLMADLLKKHGGDVKGLSKEAIKGAAHITAHTAAAAEGQDSESTVQMDVSPGVDADGNPTIAIHDMDHPDMHEITGGATAEEDAINGVGKKHKAKKPKTKKPHKGLLKKFTDKIAHDVKAVAHGVMHAAVAVKNVNVKVAALPARKAFLGLISINAHGLATALNQALHNPHDAAELDKKWKNHGGSVNTLHATIAKGAKHKKVGHRMSGGDSVSVWTTLAHAIINLFGAILKKHHYDEEGADQAAAEGQAHLIKKAHHAATMAQDGEADVLQDETAPADEGSMAITPGVDADGNATIAVHDIDHPDLPGAGQDPDTGMQTTDSTDMAPSSGTSNVMEKAKEFFNNLPETIKKYQTPLLVLGGVGLAYKVVPALVGGKRKRRRR